MTRPIIGIGMIGSGWMAKAHTAALRSIATAAATPFDIKLVSLAGRSPERTVETAAQWGFQRATTNWAELVEDPQVDVVLNLTGNDAHLKPTVAALELGKHVMCEKPLAIATPDWQQMVDAARASSAVAACGYNYRFIPAIRVARELVQSGRLGAIRHVRVAYEQDWASHESARVGWRFEDVVEGSVVYDLSHILDLLRFTIGEPESVVGAVSTLASGTQTGAGTRPAEIGVDSEDSYSAMAVLEGGIEVELRASRISTGLKGRQSLEITGSTGSLFWNMEDFNRLHFYTEEDDSLARGYRDILVTEMEHPFMGSWYAPGHIIGWEQTVTHQWISVLNKIAPFDSSIPTDFATFDDGARAVQIADAIRESSLRSSWTATPDFY